MTIEVDLDQEPAPSDPGSWLDHPKRVAVGTIAIGVLVIAIVAVVLPALREARAPLAAPSSSPTAAACQCLAGGAAVPLPAFAITEIVKGDLFPYEDTGRWTWLQMIWIPATFESQPGLNLIELQTASTKWPRIAIATGGPRELAIRVHDATSALAAGRVVGFSAAAVYDRWSVLRVTSADVPNGDELTMTLTDADGVTASTSLAVADDFHGPVTGFGLLAPDGGSVLVPPGPQVKYGPPSFMTTC